MNISKNNDSYFLITTSWNSARVIIKYWCPQNHPKPCAEASTNHSFFWNGKSPEIKANDNPLLRFINSTQISNALSASWSNVTILVSSFRDIKYEMCEMNGRPNGITHEAYTKLPYSFSISLNRTKSQNFHSLGGNLTFFNVYECTCYSPKF